MRRAEEEGLDLFVAAPLPTFKATAPKLMPQHGRASGMVQTSIEAKRLDNSLTGDYFKRPAWNCSILPKPSTEDKRTLETVARHKREDVMEVELARKHIHLVGLHGGKDGRPTTPSTPSCGAAGSRPSTRQSRAGPGCGASFAGAAGLHGAAAFHLGTPTGSGRCPKR